LTVIATCLLEQQLGRELQLNEVLAALITQNCAFDLFVTGEPKKTCLSALKLSTGPCSLRFVCKTKFLKSESPCSHNWARGDLARWTQVSLEMFIG
jgi:hypothetical protein